jgi:hypothetical protein
MANTSRVPDHYAVLIGIDFYTEIPLHGCVRDVDAIVRYLQSKSTPVHIEKFVASTPTQPISSVLSEPPELWPTFENVTSCFRRITSLGQPGDWIYIHYSGHGTRIEASSEYSNTSTGDLALDLLDGTNVNRIRYLRGLELAHLVDNMVKKGLRVTVVLDCCFSGSVLRGKYAEVVRSLKYDHIVDATYPPNVNQSLNYQHVPTFRDASMLPSWLIHPDGYTILTACGPHEVAEELMFESGDRRGALSYFLLSTLSQLRNEDTTHKHIYHHLCAKFHAYWPRQNPMFYGNKDLSFFGQLRSDLDLNFIPVIRTDEGRLYFTAGQAHGIIKDHRYTLHPFKAPKDVMDQGMGEAVIARVAIVRGLTSDLVGEDNTALPECVDTGWIARPLTRFSAQRVPIRLMSNVGNSDLILQADQYTRSLDFHTDDAIGIPVLFNITVNDRNEFEIQNESYERIMSLPTISVNQEGAWDKIKSIMEHLAKFKQIEAIENQNPTPSLDNSFYIQVNASSRDAYNSKGVLEVKDNDPLELVVRNDGASCLYVHIYAMGPCWQVENLLSADYLTLPPKDELNGYSGSLSKKLLMTVPDSLKEIGQQECEDIIKIFITRQRTSFSVLELGKIPTSPGTLRGTVSENLTQLLMLSPEIDTTHFRGGAGENTLEEWAAQNFRVRTVAQRI